ncbi:MAG TPA: 6-pyruvoyl tetrahydropterin synthase family protein [Gemmatimonadales bacterium]|nr:6-pyruvoyl tetrahydropterin synthase family protein [Gemmatimonadales bacterium]
MNQAGTYRISVAKEDLNFAAAHFITFAGHRCETLHGHNYRAAVLLDGTLDQESWYVVDFSAVKKIMRRLTAELDHKVLLPLENPRLQVSTKDGAVHVAYEHKPRYVFPEKDCVLLPIPNTTVEMLATMLGGKLAKELGEAGAKTITALELEVEENFGQSATYRMTV